MTSTIARSPTPSTMRTTTRRLQPPTNRGVWSVAEHDRFLAALEIHPRGPWRIVAKIVGTRDPRQVQTHAQKYYEKLERHQRGLQRTRRCWVRMEHRLVAPPGTGLHVPMPSTTIAPANDCSDGGGDSEKATSGPDPLVIMAKDVVDPLLRPSALFNPKLELNETSGRWSPQTVGGEGLLTLEETLDLLREVLLDDDNNALAVGPRSGSAAPCS